MEIKYEVEKGDVTSRCLTPCPNGVKGFVELVGVGSAMCSTCKHFVSDDEKKQIVTCKYKAHTADK